MNVLDSLRQRTQALREKSPSVVNHNSTDSAVLRDMVERSSVLSGAISTPPLDFGEESKPYVAWDDLVGDAYRSYHTIEDPGVKHSDECLPSRELNRRIMQRRIGTEAFSKLHAKTQHDRNASAFATLAETEELSKLLEDELPAFMDQVREMQEQEQKVKDLEQPGAEGNPADLGMQLAEARKKLAEMLQEQSDQPLGQAVTDAIEQAQEAAEDKLDAFMSLPGVEPGSPITNRPDDMLALANRWHATKEMRDLAKQIGRFTKDMEVKRESKLVGGPGEIVDITLGDDLERVLPSELALLRHPIMRRDFIRRFLEHSLLQYETVGDVLAGLGPLVAVIDGSLSMAGTRTLWARAVGISLILNLHRENRDVCMVEFSLEVTKAWDFLAGMPLDPETIVDFASHFFNGGTNITRGVQRAEEFINGRPEFTRADIVVITDGEDHFEEEDEEMRDRLRAQGVRFHGVAIGHTPAQGGYLTQLCDTLVGAHELADPGRATDALARST